MSFCAATRDYIQAPRKGGMPKLLVHQGCVVSILRATGYTVLFSCVTLDKSFYPFEPVSCENRKTYFEQMFL